MKEESALSSFRQGITCSSSVFSAFSEELGLDPDLARKIACGFGAGVSRTGNLCGAVSGAILVIGLKYGKARPGEDANTVRTRALVREFLSRFTAKNGSVNCTVLLGWNLDDPGEYEKARVSGLFQTRCFDLVRDAILILEELLTEEKLP